MSTAVSVQMPDVILPPRPPPPVLPPKDPERDDPNEPDHKPPLVPPPPVLNRSWNRRARPAVWSAGFAQVRGHRAGQVFAFGSIVLARFPFTDLSGDKRRPAPVVSRDNQCRADLVVCFVTSVLRAGPDMAFGMA